MADAAAASARKRPRDEAAECDAASTDATDGSSEQPPPKRARRAVLDNDDSDDDDYDDDDDDDCDQRCRGCGGRDKDIDCECGTDYVTASDDDDTAGRLRPRSGIFWHEDVRDDMHNPGEIGTSDGSSADTLSVELVSVGGVPLHIEVEKVDDDDDRMLQLIRLRLTVERLHSQSKPDSFEVQLFHQHRSPTEPPTLLASAHMQRYSNALIVSGITEYNTGNKYTCKADDYLARHLLLLVAKSQSRALQIGNHSSITGSIVGVSPYARGVADCFAGVARRIKRFMDYQPQHAPATQ